MSQLKKDFKKVRYVGWEGTYTPHVDREKRTMEYTVIWNKDNQRGWFEIYDQESGGEDYYGEGGLWFKGNELIDYDGVFEIDEEVVKCLKDWGADVSYVE